MAKRLKGWDIQKDLDFAMASLKAGRLSEAQGIYQRVLQVDPDHPDALHLLGVISLQLGKGDEAVGFITRAVASKPDFPKAHNNLGAALQQLGRFDEAIASYRNALSNQPDLDDAHHNLGNAYKEVGKFDEAVSSYRQAISLNPDSAGTHFNLGDVLRGLGKFDDALICYRKAVSINPGFAVAHNSIGNICKEQGDLEEAIVNYRRALVLEPNLLAAHNGLGLALQLQGHLDEAVNCYREVLATKPDYANALNSLGTALSERGEVDDALDSYRKALTIDPDFAEAHFNLAVGLPRQGKPEEAIASYRRAITIRPDYFDAINNLGVVLTDSGRLDEAFECLKQAIVLNPDSADAHNNLGQVHRELGNLEDAVESFGKAIVLNPASADAHNNLANTFRELGRTSQALEHSLKALELKPDGHVYLDVLLRAAPEIDSEAVIEKIRRLAPVSIEPDLLAYALSCFSPDDTAADHFHRVHEKLTTQQHDVQALEPSTGEGRARRSAQPLPAKTVALLQWGRSGTGFMHSLFDNHPQISTIPGFYMGGFFDRGVWPAMKTSSRRDLIRHFSDSYEVLFDSYNPKPVPGEMLSKRLSHGVKEGYTTMGPNQDQSLSLDRDAFAENLDDLLAGSDEVSQATFFKMLHVAFDRTLGRDTNPELIFYHLHNPSVHELLNYLRQVDNSRLLLAVREPLQSCESWIHLAAQKDSPYPIVVRRLVECLFKFDQIPFRFFDARGLRLEDIKLEPRETMRRVCRWLEIDHDEALFSSTFQGLEWWGEASSLRFGRTKPITGFGINDTEHGGDPIMRKPGYFFSDKDQFILNTIFEPVRVLYGYAEKNDAAFQKNLNEIRPLLDEPFDFEQDIIDKTMTGHPDPKGNAHYLYLRAALKDRWQTLNANGTYPGMIRPMHETLKGCAGL